jgi:N-acetylneuraminate synthase/N,N'-diacetyllegionaminate synthase
MLNPVFFIAEIGGNHEGDFDYAKKLLKLAINSGVDAVKFQIYKGNSLVSKRESPDRNQHFKRFELYIDQYIEIANICKENKVLFMASIWDLELLAIMNPYISIHKVGSGDITAFPLLKAMVATGKPIIVSTGLCTMEEVRDVVTYISSLDKNYIEMKKLALLQCTTAYPCPDTDVNLNAMSSIRDQFQLPVGYSDHTIGLEAVQTAVAMGAEIIEMHFTDTRTEKTFRDHQVSATCDEIKSMMKKFSRIKVFQGSCSKAPTNSELTSGNVKSFRRSIYAKRTIKKGEYISENNITILRPNVGIPATKYDDILGRRVLRKIDVHCPVHDSDLEPASKYQSQ